MLDSCSSAIELRDTMQRLRRELCHPNRLQPPPGLALSWNRKHSTHVSRLLTIYSLAIPVLVTSSVRRMYIRPTPQLDNVTSSARMCRHYIRNRHAHMRRTNEYAKSWYSPHVLVFSFLFTQLNSTHISLAHTAPHTLWWFVFILHNTPIILFRFPWQMVMFFTSFLFMCFVSFIYVPADRNHISTSCNSPFLPQPIQTIISWLKHL